MTLDYRDLRTVDQIAAENPAITRNRLRWWIYEGESNGFDTCVVRIGRVIYIHLPSFNRWLADRKGRAA